MAEPLTPDEIKAALSELIGWRVENDRLVKEFQFSNFREAVSFMVRLAFPVDQNNHHPEIFWANDKIKLELFTHNAGNKISKRDVNIAREIEKFNWLK